MSTPANVTPQMLKLTDYFMSNEGFPSVARIKKESGNQQCPDFPILVLPLVLTWPSVSLFFFFSQFDALNLCHKPEEQMTS